jgi:hypothetical protein
VNDAFLMSRRERVAELAGNLDNLLDRESALGNQAIKGQAFY